MNTLGLIPARAGSKGVPGKNQRLLCGRPLVDYTFEAALNSCLDRVILSTDSTEIAALGQSAGVDVPFIRPDSISDDEATAQSVISHALKAVCNADNWKPDIVLYLQPTSPFRSAANIDEAIKILSGSNADSVISLAATVEHPAYMFFDNERGGVVDVIDPAQHRKERRQDLVKTYSANCAIMGSRHSFLEGSGTDNGLIVNFANFCPFFIEPPLTVDINTEQDFRFAEYLMNNQKEKIS
jgi:CMP-N,N'-diacetyllegionaminic acid synthase